MTGPVQSIRAEAFKAVTLPSVVALAVATVAVGAGFGALARAVGDAPAAVAVPWIQLTLAGFGATVAGSELAGGQLRSSLLTVPRRYVFGAAQLTVIALASLGLAALAVVSAGVPLTADLVLAVALGGWLGATATIALASTLGGVVLVATLAVVATALGPQSPAALDRMPLDLVMTFTSPSSGPGARGPAIALAVWYVAGGVGAGLRLRRDVG
ncbi:MAG: hypothetical protein ACK5PP_13055 [Acidimicrobiales bacterium]